MSEQFSAKHYAKKAQKWATGTIAQCQGGSAKHWAQVAEATAGSIGDPANRDLSNLTDVGLLKFDAKQDILTPGNNIEIDENGVISTNASSLPLFLSFKTGHILNNASYVNGCLFSWLSGAVYTSAYQELVKEMTGSTTGQLTSQTLYAWADNECVIYTETLTPTSDADLRNADGTAYVFDGTYPKYFVEGGRVYGYSNAKNEGLGEGLAIVRSASLDKVIAQTIAEQKTQTIAGVTITYFLTATNKKICLPDQADNVASLYAATGAADFYLLDTENGQFKLPRSNARRLLRSYKEGDSWYNLYSDGWCEQGGSCVAPNNELITINLKQSYQDINYDILLTQGLANSARYQGRHPIVNSDLMTVNSFVLQNARFLAETTAASKIYWRTSGYADTSIIQDEFEYVYYFLGNAVQNQTFVDVGQMTQTLTNKADVDLNNAQPCDNFKQQIMNWLMPDYTSPVSVPNGVIFTAPCPGYLNCADARSGTGSGTIKIAVNGVNVRVWEWQGNYAANTYQYMVSKNDEIFLTVSAASLECIFYPMKGAL